MSAYQIYRLPAAVLFSGGVLAPGWYVKFYLTGTTIPVDVWTTDELDTEHDWPVEAGSDGVLPVVYLDPAVVYKTEVYDQFDVLQPGYGADPVNESINPYPILPIEGATVVNGLLPYGHVLRYGTNTTPGTTDLTTAIQAALDANYTVTLPDEDVAFTSFTWKLRRQIVGGATRESRLVQLSSMNGSATPAVTLEDVTSTDIAEGGYRAQRCEIVVASQTGIYCGGTTNASMFSSDQFCLTSRQAASNGSVPYSTIANQRAIHIEAGGTTAAFFANHRNLEIRAFDIGVDASGGVNEWTIHGWMLDCRIAVRLEDCSTWDLSGVTVESSVEDARALYADETVSNVKWDGGRWEMTQADSYGVEGDAALDSGSSNWWFTGINVLIASDGSAIPGRKWTGTLPDNFVFSGVDTVGPFIHIPNQVTMRLPNELLIGGQNLGDGKITLGRDLGGGEATLENVAAGRAVLTGTNSVDLQVGGTPVNTLRVDDSATATHVRLLVYDVDNGQLERVTVGAADSGGAGFKVLRIPN